MPPRIFAVVLAALAVACAEPPEDPAPEPWAWALPEGLPMPVVPADNPMSVAKFELGRRLFYDKRLSGNQTQSCASCHDQALAFTDGEAHAEGSTGQIHPRGAMSLVNVAYAATLTWANPVQRELEAQALVPMFGEFPVELGLAGMEDELLARLQADDMYPQMFRAAFLDEAEPISLDTITKALACFERALISGDSDYDRSYYAGGELSDAARRGMALFFSETHECHHCHGGFNLSDSVTFDGYAFNDTPFHNTGMYDLDGAGAYPADNIGLSQHTGRAADMGRFKAPTLRNIALTAPYMHDGSMATLEEVLDHYAAGGRTIDSGEYAGDGSQNPYKSGFVGGFEMSAQDRADLVAFLESLTDWAFITDPRFGDPFAE
jgi:cytochrome c peroxidase